MANERNLSSAQTEELLKTLQARFERNMHRHEGLAWPALRAQLEAAPEKLWSLSEMERTGGEPDVIGHDPDAREYVYCDCSAESPAGRRNLCYDPRAWESRKENKPRGSAVDEAGAMGIEILTEAQYRALQRLEKVDTKTSSWILTPPEIRNRGGALFCDRRYDHVFVYHNGAESYYAVRGFRGMIKISG